MADRPAMTLMRAAAPLASKAPAHWKPAARTDQPALRTPPRTLPAWTPKAKVAVATTQAPQYRNNELGIQMLSRNLHEQLFPDAAGHRFPTDDMADAAIAEMRTDCLRLAQEHLALNNLIGKNLEALPDIRMQLPPLVRIDKGGIQEHFYALGLEQAEPFLSHAQALASATLPPAPTSWSRKKGWVRYEPDGSAHSIEHPPAGEPLIFDVEVMYKMSNFPALAIAASPHAWYSWCSPELCNPRRATSRPRPVPRTLIPLGAPQIPRIVVGHNVAYDRSRVLEEYNIDSTQLGFIDTMSLHCAVSGMSSQQRNRWKKVMSEKSAQDESDKESEKESDSASTSPSSKSQKAKQAQSEQPEHDPGQNKEEDRWIGLTSLSSLKDVALLHLGIDLDKSSREIFSDTSLDALEDPDVFQEAMQYCSEDVRVTHSVYAKLLPKFREKCPHPVSFAGMLQIPKGILPVTDNWINYINRCEKLYGDYQNKIQSELINLAEKALKNQKNDKYKNDPWLRYLNWTVKPVRMTQPKVSASGEIIKPARPYKTSVDPKLIDKPQWYRDLWDNKTGRLEISSSKRVVPYLLRLQWDTHPVSFCPAYGWMYYRPKSDTKSLDPTQTEQPQGSSKETASSSEETIEPLQTDTKPKDLKPLEFSQNSSDKNYDPIASFDTKHNYFRIPHPDGEDANCGSLLSKLYASAFDSGLLRSEYPAAQRILEMHVQSTYWISSRTRVMSQFVVWDGKDGVNVGAQPAPEKGKKLGVILPQLVPMGTITRRTIEPTWLTASNAKAKRIGSELKTLVSAPKGWSIVGADVDSEELWIASLMGDAQFGMHGSSAIGFMTLQGIKSAGTDLHSTTGRILGISRDNAKIFNYGRIYGAGQRYAIQLLLQSNPNMSPEQAKTKAVNLYKQTKGDRIYKFNIESISSLWYGGTESVMFNVLEMIASSKNPRTPVLQCQIPDALMCHNVDKQYMTSRINWAVQSSGVDYLHLLLVSMNYLMRRLDIKGRFMISIHDEVRYLVRDEDVDLACLALQISNLWVRSMFSSRMNIDDLPLNVAFFSLIDVDHCLRKEVDMPCVTPTNNVPVAPGESYTITQTLERLQSRMHDINISGPELPSITNAVATLQKTPRGFKLPPPWEKIASVNVLKAQISPNRDQITSIMSSLKKQKSFKKKPAGQAKSTSKTKGKGSKDSNDGDDADAAVKKTSWQKQD